MDDLKPSSIAPRAFVVRTFPCQVVSAVITVSSFTFYLTVSC
jgi:hypothetical protein